LQKAQGAGHPAAWSQTFSYDLYDNITKSGSLSWQPGYNSANNHYTLGGTSYDSAGNVLKDTFNAYTWAANGKVASVIAGSTPATCSTNGVCPIYDAFGRVVELNAAGVFSQILYSPIGKTASMNGQTMSKVYVPLPGGSTLFVTSGAKNIWHKDWLGTVRLSSTYSNRTVTMDRAFAPFGEIYKTLSGGTTNQNFTGDTQDTFAGLFDTPFRELHPQQGRWVSPDPASVGWNLYAYVMNSPLNLVDSLGLVPCRPGAPGYEDDCPSTSSSGPGGINDALGGPLGGLDTGPFPLIFLGATRGGRGGVDSVEAAAPTQAANNCKPLTQGCLNVPTRQQQQGCSAVYNKYVSDMNALNAKYAGGWKEAAAIGIPGVVVTQPGLYGMANRISQANAKILGFVGMIFPTVFHTGWAAATEEGQERRALGNSYASDMQQCDPTK
jgi:RHS repeat-associated protein